MSELVTTEQRPLVQKARFEANKALALLFAAYPEPFSKSAVEAKSLSEARTSAYLLALQGIPGWAVEQAVTDFIQGKVERKPSRRGVLPTAEELAVVAREHLERESDRQRREKLIQEQRKERAAERAKEEWLKSPEGKKQREQQAQRIAQIMREAGLRPMTNDGV